MKIQILNPSFYCMNNNNNRLMLTGINIALFKGTSKSCLDLYGHCRRHLL
jgi:hypothetical protein